MDRAPRRGGLLHAIGAFFTGFSKGVADVRREKELRDSYIVCPQCQSRGTVTTEQVKMKKGISGGKATGAVLTGGVSLLLTGLSRKEGVTEATCSKCGSVWHF
jgi:DNA-directed RNA polymerase subunit RPC12/RpoP